MSATNDITSEKRSSPPPKPVPLGDDTRARIKQMLEDLDTPLDGLPNSGNDPDLARKYRQTKRATRNAVREQERAELKRARRAARRIYNVKPTRSSKRAATALLTAGAVGLAAFTGPVTTKMRDKNGPVATYIMKETAETALDPTQVRVNAKELRASTEFKSALVEEEGVRYTVYRDVAGYPTVGVGHLIDVSDNLRVGDTVSKERVLEFLDVDLQEAEAQVADLVGDLPLYQHEFDALVDLLFNVGPGTVAANKSPRLNAAIEAGDYEAIAAELDYTHAAGKVARGLEYRSERRTKMFLDASYEDPREVGASTSA